MPDIGERMRPPPEHVAAEPDAAEVAELVAKIKAAESSLGDGAERRIEALIEKRRAEINAGVKAAEPSASGDQKE